MTAGSESLSLSKPRCSGRAADCFHGAEGRALDTTKGRTTLGPIEPLALRKQDQHANTQRGAPGLATRTGRGWGGTH